MSEFKADSISTLNSKDSWYESVNVEALSDEAKRAILEAVKNKLGFSKACEVLDIAKSSLHRYLSGERKIPSDVIKRALKFLTKSEFESIISGWDKLKAFGIIREDGVVDYGLVLKILAIAAKDEYLKNAILRFVVENFREDLKKMLGISFTGIKLEWCEDFENFLMERKKRRKVKDVETLNYYKSLFMRYLQGKELSEQLIDYVVNHENKWLRNIFRHYIQYLYYKRKISPETFGWIMEVVPSRGYKLDVRPYPINLDDVRKTFEFLKNNHQVYYTIYRAMLESGARFEHVLKMIESWSPNEVIEIPGIGIETKRLVCFEDKGFCRYYMGLRESEKPCEWIYISLETTEMIQKIVGKRISRQNVWRYAKRHGLIAPKYMRKVAWRLMVKAMNREVARFIQSRLGELRISEARYEDLLSEADEAYPKYLQIVKELTETNGNS
ncbi:integrase protein [Ignisphaera aggregans DSM 17230]|uniref:Integrase protein n=1 Tax=Ignisphaera aggregans (strain DSM 17230 / JCM 13409 / AQ1.S1) TaxID=583356 RepID=E0STG3_IGNAA|nr:integrase protein [Ignisphaera aggregans DSM 17230]